MSKLTPWFTNINPKRKGVYETRTDNFTALQGWSYWNGREWSTTWGSVRAAYKYGPRESGSKLQKSWRGLKHQP